MRILHVSEVNWGGVVSLLRAFTEHQTASGAEVHLLAPPIDGLSPGLVEHRWRIDRSQPKTVPGAVRQLRDVVNQSAPDVVHLHSFVAGFLGRVPGVIPRGANSPAVVYQPHAWSPELYSDPVRPRMIRLSERAAASRTDLLVTNCQDEIDQGAEFGVRLPARSLGVSVDASVYHPGDEAEADQFRRDHGLDAAHVIVCVGRLAWQKGQDLLVEAWEQSPIPDTQLVLVGPGDPGWLSGRAPREWGRSIRWVGQQDDVRPWLWASDLLVLPSRYETVALVVAEALACARPVVATAVNGARDTLLAGPEAPGGAVVSVGDMSSLLSKAAERLADASLRRAEGRAGRLRAIEKFAPDLVGGRLMDSYDEASRVAKHRLAVKR